MIEASGSSAVPSELDALCREFERDRPNVVVVVGAGVSWAASGEEDRARWQGLLEHGVKTLHAAGEWEDDIAKANLLLIDKAFNSPVFDLAEVLARADSILKALGEPAGLAYAAWLEAAIGSLTAKPDKSETLEAIFQLEQAGALILTTNYDDLLRDEAEKERPPVTWKDTQGILRMLKRDGDQRRIIHIHGHWKSPASVVLGNRSYAEIKNDDALQTLLKSVWLHWSWLYVGCGNGISDPNIGKLLAWCNEKFGDAADNHYFLAQRSEATALSARADKPANLLAVGYDDHDTDLPRILRALAPRPRHIVELGPDIGLVRDDSTSALDIPLPSWQELIAGDVPPLATDLEVTEALRTHGWALVFDLAAIGKTTLALRIATGVAYRDLPTFYVDLADLGSSREADDESSSVRRAVRHLARTKALIVLDNANWAPKLVRQIWEEWIARPRASHLLMLATRVQRTAGLAGDDALTLVERHPHNPPIQLSPTVGDLLSISRYVLKRVYGRDVPLDPPDSVLATWYAAFAHDIGAFVVAATGHSLRLCQGHWELPPSAAAAWIRNRHLRDLPPDDQSNLVCLSVFASQKLELNVLQDALPYPERVDELLLRGLAERRILGKERRSYYVLRAADWGALLLAAVHPAPNVSQVLLDAAARHPMTALSLGVRLASLADRTALTDLWECLRKHEARDSQFMTQLVSMPFEFTLHWRGLVTKNGAPDLADRGFDAWQASPSRTAEEASGARLGSVARFIEAASAENRSDLVDALWAAVQNGPGQLVGRAMDATLSELTIFSRLAWGEGQSAVLQTLWQALEADPDPFVERALETPVSDLREFIDVARTLKRPKLVNTLKRALENDPGRFVERTLEAAPTELTSFIDAAWKNGWRTLANGLWIALEGAIEQQPERLVDRLVEAAPGQIAAFLETAAARNRSMLVDTVWRALERQPERLAARFTEASLGQIAAFFEIAAAHNRGVLVDAIRTALEPQSERLVARAFETSVGEVTAFLERAAAHNRSAFVDAIWAALERQPERLAARLTEASLGQIAAFIALAAAQDRSVLLTAIWAALERQPERMAARAFDTSLGEVTTFLERAAAHDRLALVETIWVALERQPERMAAYAFDISVSEIGAFLERASAHNRLTLVAAIWALLEREPKRLQSAVSELDGANLRGFLMRAPEAIGRLAIAQLDFADWALSRQKLKPLWGAPRLATQFAKLGRDDLADDLRRHVVWKADPAWFRSPWAIIDVAVLLSNLSKHDEGGVQRFLENVCTRSWINNQYTGKSTSSLLADALVLLALSRPTSDLRRFIAPALRRVDAALEGLKTALGQDLCGHVQFLGAVQLTGWRIARGPFAAAHIDRIARLPSDVLPHRSEADGIERYQRILWLGLRVVASLGPKPLSIDRAILRDTLDRWQKSLGESASMPEAAPHRLNQSMVAWLKLCDRGGKLVPATQPLWVICDSVGE